jgi:hypothetical protein
MFRVRTVLAAAGLLLLMGFAKPEFKEFANKAGGFKVQMPGAPKEQNQAGTATYTVESGNNAYSVAFTKLPDAGAQTDELLQTVLDAAVDGGVKGGNATLDNKKKITLAGKYPGREYSATIKNGNGLMIRSKMYIANKKLYQVIVVGDKDFITSDDAVKFLDSLVVE